MANEVGDKKKSEPTEVTFQRFQVSGKILKSNFISCSYIGVYIKKYNPLLLIFTEILQNVVLVTGSLKVYL